MTANQLFGLLLVVVSPIPLHFVRKALRTGSVRLGDQVSKSTHHRADEPAAFWFGVALGTCASLVSAQWVCFGQQGLARRLSRIT
ncbi:MAG: hypothetical protein WD226_01525 [Planctomycetota bacterium]